MNPLVDLLADHNEDGSVRLSSPRPGKVRFTRCAGEVLVPGSRLGLLICDQVTFVLTVPEGVHGQLVEPVPRDPWLVCGFGRELATVAPYAGRADAAEALADAAQTGSGLAIRAPSHGTFYRSSGPNAAPFVQVGQTIREGDTVGLVEVMKCFSPILFSPPAGITAATVRELVAADGVEVQSNQVLLHVDPI